MPHCEFSKGARSVPSFLRSSFGGWETGESRSHCCPHSYHGLVNCERWRHYLTIFHTSRKNVHCQSWFFVHPQYKRPALLGPKLLSPIVFPLPVLPIWPRVQAASKPYFCIAIFCMPADGPSYCCHCHTAPCVPIHNTRCPQEYHLHDMLSISRTRIISWSDFYQKLPAERVVIYVWNHGCWRGGDKNLGSGESLRGRERTQRQMGTE